VSRVRFGLRASLRPGAGNGARLKPATHLVGWMVAVCLFLAACAPPSGITPTADPVLHSAVRAACATTTYRNCELDTLDLIRSVPSGTLVVICDRGNGNGRAVTTANRADADDNCSEGGTVDPSKVVAVISVP